MKLNTTHTLNNFQFENRENLRNVARNILNRKGSSEASTQFILELTKMEHKDVDKYINPQLAIIKASNQISANNTLKETLKYLKQNYLNKSHKKVKFGELWNIVNEIDETKSLNNLLEFEIDENAVNIFAVA